MAAVGDAAEEARKEDVGEEAVLRADVPRVLAEVFSCFFWVIIILLLVAAFGLFRVKPPGEEDLCAVQTLGLANATEAKQETVLLACHGLFKTVFLFTRTFCAAFLLVGVLPLGFLVLARAVRQHSGAGAAVRYTLAAVLDVLSVLVLWLPSSILLTLSASVTVVMAPLTAQWLAIYAAYFGMKAAHQQPPHWLEIIYLSYCACWYADTFLWVGTWGVLLLWGLSFADAVRNVLAAVGFRPRWDDLQGNSEVCRLRRLWCSKVRGCCAAPAARLGSATVAAQEWSCVGCWAWLDDHCSAGWDCFSSKGKRQGAASAADEAESGYRKL